MLKSNMQTSISNNEVQSRVQKVEHWTWQLNVKNFGDGSLAERYVGFGQDSFKNKKKEQTLSSMYLS